MLVKVLTKRIHHEAQNGNIGSKITIEPERGNKPLDKPEPKMDALTIGQYICADKSDNGFWRISDDQSAAEGNADQTENVKQIFNGTQVKEIMATPEDIQNRSNGNSLFQDSARLLTNCINHMNANLDGNRFSSEDCRTAGISLFIFLTKATKL
jgi:hypothetical protein